MALSNEDKAEIRKMISEDKADMKKTIREEIKKVIPDIFGRSLEQLRAFFISNIS
jgi:hypothetical protein